MLSLVFALLANRPVLGQDLPVGRIIEAVECRDDASQHYALYVPSAFTPERQWPVIVAFGAGGRGRRGVERYQAAAEKYGYLVSEVFVGLRERVMRLLEQSKTAKDSTERRIARRILAGLNASSRSISHPEFQELLNQIRPPGQPGGPR